MTNAPSGAAAAAAPVAPIPRRALAYVIDAVIASLIGVIGVVVTFAVGANGGRGLSETVNALILGIGITGVVTLVWFLVYCLLQGSGGSLGMRIMKLRLVRDRSGAPLGFGRALLRNIVFGLSATIIVGYFTPLFDGSGRFQGWHDRAAGALMLDRRAAVVPAAVVPAAPGVPAASGAPAAPAAPGLAPVALSPVAPSPVPSPATVFAPAPVEADPHDATVLSPATQAAVDAAQGAADDAAMITVVPGVSPAVRSPAVPVVSGPETVAPARPPVPAAPPATVAAALAQAPVVQAAADEDDPEETRISIPGHRLQFVWDDGARATVSGRTLFGRNPAPEAGTTGVVVRDETLSLSKTHFEAAAEAAGGWVMDRHSTNGMTIVRDGVRIACPPGERVRVRLGDAIEIGERIVTVGGYA